MTNLCSIVDNLIFCCQKYEVTGIPTLVVVTRKGEVISRNGRSEVMEKGPQIFQKWIAATR